MSNENEEANLCHWKSSAEPEAWVRKHLQGWNNNDWLELLVSLQRTSYWPMNEAAIGQHIEMLRAKVKMAEVKQPPKDNIHTAANVGDLETVRMLVENNPNLVFSKGYDGKTPLHDAADNGHTEVVRFLLVNDADVNAKNDNGSTPLHFAALEGHKDVAQLLLINGADVNAKARGGDTPLGFSRSGGYKGGVAELLRRRGGRE